LDIRPAEWVILADHEPFSEVVAKAAIRAGAEATLTTEKDAVKLGVDQEVPVPIWYLRMAISVMEESEFLDVVVAAIGKAAQKV
jgi:tetraacyldisaccharide-1-P 4'-kinase